MAFTLAAASLTALFMESVFYGLYLDTFFRTLHALLFARGAFKRGNVQWKLLVVACLMFLVGTVDIALLFERNFDAFVQYTGPGGPDARLQDIRDWNNPARVRVQTLL